MPKKTYVLKSELGEFKVEVDISFGNERWTVICDEPNIMTSSRSKHFALEEMKDQLVRLMVGG